MDKKQAEIIYDLELENKNLDENFLFKTYNIYAKDTFSSKKIYDLGKITCCELDIEKLTVFIKKYKNEWIDVFCEVFNTLEDEALSITSNIQKGITYTYLQSINIGHNKGHNIGYHAIKAFEKKCSETCIIFYPYPIPTRWELGFDRKYMDEAKSKIINFYSKLDYQYLKKQNIMFKHK